MKIKFVKTEKCKKPTVWAYLALLLIIMIAGYYWFTHVYRFLTIKEEVPAKTMVIEGWVRDYVLDEAMQYYKSHHFENMIVTGIPVTFRRLYANYDNTAELAEAYLKGHGFEDTIYKAVVPSGVIIDRTFNTAIATKLLFEQNPGWEKNLLIYSEGVHARRTKRMFDLVFDKNYRLGIIAAKEKVFDEAHFWRTSKGFRTVSNEFVAWIWTRLFFHPDVEKEEQRFKNLAYIDTVIREREAKDREFADTATSPLEKEDLKTFKGIPWYPVDPDWRIPAKVVVDTSGPVFEMATNTSRKPKYRKYAILSFKVADTVCTLTVFQNMEHIHHPEYGKYLFVPFRDKTNGKTTYAAGRYLDIYIPESDSILLDFNRAYNPYCAYAHRWSCPLVPFENDLPVHIFAGEKKYK